MVLLKHEIEQMCGPSTARTRETEFQYLDRVHKFIRDAKAKRAPDPETDVIITPMDLVDDLFEKADSLAANSWKTYRSALLWYLAVKRKVAPAYEEAYTRVAAAATKPAPAPTRERSTRKPPKSISEAHFTTLVAQLSTMNRHSGWGTRTQYWLHAAIATGARPQEWVGAGWAEPGSGLLRLNNAKRKIAKPSQLGGTGKTIHDVESATPELIDPGLLLDPERDFRTVPIDAKDRLWVGQHLSALAAYTATRPELSALKAYKAYYNVCRSVLTDACHRAFAGKRLYSLYVMRSQFASNKKAVLPLDEVAALMGHESDKTTRSFYGRRKDAFGGKGDEKPVSSSRQKMAPAPSKDPKQRG